MEAEKLSYCEALYGIIYVQKDSDSFFIEIQNEVGSEVASKVGSKVGSEVASKVGSKVGSEIVKGAYYGETNINYQTDI